MYEPICNSVVRSFVIQAPSCKMILAVSSAAQDKLPVQLSNLFFFSQVTFWSYWCYPSNLHIRFQPQNRHHIPISSITSLIREVGSSETCAYHCARDTSCVEFIHSSEYEICTLSQTCPTMATEWTLNFDGSYFDVVNMIGRLL